MSDSPVKKLDYTPADKENVFRPIVGIPDLEEDKGDELNKKPTVAPTIKEEEADEPLLQENPGRFVLFPIKYHEVSLTRLFTRKVVLALTFSSLGLADVQEG